MISRSSSVPPSDKTTSAPGAAAVGPDAAVETGAPFTVTRGAQRFSSRNANTSGSQAARPSCTKWCPSSAVRPTAG